MKKVLISVLVSSLLLGAIIAKPKAKVVEAEVPQTPVQIEPKLLPITTFPELVEHIRNRYTTLFQGVHGEGVVFEEAMTKGSENMFWNIWFVGEADKSFDKTIWGTYEFEVNPYKKEIRGFPSKDVFVEHLQKVVRYSDEELVLEDYHRYPNAFSSLEERFSSSKEDQMAAFGFIWMLSDGYYVFFPREPIPYYHDYTDDRYKYAVGWVVPVRPDPKTGKVSADYNYSKMFRPEIPFIQDSRYPQVKKHSFDEFSSLLEARLKKDGTAEQLAQWNLIKQEMQSYFAE